MVTAVIGHILQERGRKDSQSDSERKTVERGRGGKWMFNCWSLSMNKGFETSHLSLHENEAKSAVEQIPTVLAPDCFFSCEVCAPVVNLNTQMLDSTLLDIN